MPPESLEDRFCRLDINMTVNGQRVDLEIQVNDEGDFPACYAEAVKNEFSPSAVVLYGSYANGSPHKDSDIDVAVVF